MGLIKALTGSVGGFLADQWRDYFYCDSLPPEVLVTKGVKRAEGRSSNTKGTENVISNGSIIAVADGQCMILVDQGKVTELCAEPGEFLYDSSSEPSIFYGKLGQNILNSFKNVGKRFAFGGEPPKDQRVYFFNTKEITGNKYGTMNPVPFRVVDTNIGLDVDISIRCNGEFSYHIIDPMLFYTNVCANVADAYKRDQIDSMLKGELLSALQPAFAKISAMGIRYSALPGHTTEIETALNEVLSAKWSELRGLAVKSFFINTVTAPKEDEDMIKELQRTAVMRNPNMAAATLVGAQADAMRAAATNDSGAMMGFMGLGMAQQAGGMNAQSLFQMDQQQQMQQQQMQQQQMQQQQMQQPVQPQQPQQAAPAAGWACACGCATNKGKFCENCGANRAVSCAGCGYTPADGNAPKFCPECGKAF